MALVSNSRVSCCYSCNHQSVILSWWSWSCFSCVFVSLTLCFSVWILKSLTIESKLSAAAAGSVDISWEDVAGHDDEDEDEETGQSGKMATIGLSKVFILDKYFTELQKFWETERKVQGNNLGQGGGGNEVVGKRRTFREKKICVGHWSQKALCVPQSFFFLRKSLLS